MATTLRELIAKVVFRTDPTKLKDFDARLDAAKTKLIGLDAQAKKGVRPVVDPSPLQRLGAQVKAVSEKLQELKGRVTGAVGRLGDSFKGAEPPAAGLGAGVGGLTKLVGGLGVAAAAYKAIAWGNQLVSEARAVGDLAASLSISTDELQTWSAFVGEVGGTSEDLGGTVKNLAKNIQDAAKDAKGPAAEGFRRLGLSTDSWSKQLPNTMDILLQAGSALGGLESDTERLALAQGVLGESSLKLLPAFEGGSEAARQQLESLRELAVVYDQDFIASSTAASNEMKLFEGQLKGIGVTVLMDVLPVLRDMVRWLTPVIKSTRETAKNSNILKAVLTGLGVAGAGKLFSMLGGLVTRLGGFTGLLRAGARIFARFILPMLVLDDIITFLRGGKSVLGDILDKMFGIGASKSVLDGLKKTWDGLAGGVKYFWGLLKGDQAAIAEGEAAILKFGGFMDDLFVGLGKTVDGWVTMFGEAFDFALADLSSVFEGWGNGLASYFDVLWTGIINAIHTKISEAGTAIRSFGENLPLIGNLFKGDGAGAPSPAAQLERNAANALAVGGNPAVNQSKSTSVTVTDNSSVTTTLHGVDGKNVGAALRESEGNIKAMLQRSKAQVLRQTVGAAGV
jgi:hypothetical protein